MGWAPGAAGRLEQVPSLPTSLGRATFWSTTLQLLFVRRRFPNKGLVSYRFDLNAGGRCEAKSQLALVPAGRRGLEEESQPSGADRARLCAPSFPLHLPTLSLGELVWTWELIQDDKWPLQGSTCV